MKSIGFLRWLGLEQLLQVRVIARNLALHHPVENRSGQSEESAGLPHARLPPGIVLEIGYELKNLFRRPVNNHACSYSSHAFPL